MDRGLGYFNTIREFLLRFWKVSPRAHNSSERGKPLGPALGAAESLTVKYVMGRDYRRPVGSRALVFIQPRIR